MTGDPAAPTPAPTASSWPGVLSSLVAGQDLSVDEARWAMDQIMSGAATPAQAGGFLMALRVKGESADEMRGLADEMLAHARAITVPGETLDIVGTGGDRANTVNISTMSALVVAGAGVRVVKHGNRASSSRSGSADVLEALGVSLTLPPEAVAEVAHEAGITFCFANAFHPSMANAAVPRRELGVGTAFNFLGPLTNPARPTFAAVGCADARMAPLMAGVFAGRGARAAVFRGDDGLDEVTVSTTTSVWWVADGGVTEHTLDPADLGFARHELSTLVGGDAPHNAGVVRSVLAGEAGPVRDAVLLNAGMALAVAGSESAGDQPWVEQVDAGVAAARRALDSGAAAAVLQRWVASTSARG
ncbi:anthranilate phosphoribosyltransferase [Arsenicicoccus sp. oral taxon 190]|uniref:anthranilate phosphoribosyltransferase n=1 Tax=Arsenicicoccus sp. oral taxon 190 TaxID=1658671 RepID=UPI00067A3359|nr:anthranilate phosphoribosyltransferase [Arsenicicoccus sp. oral taxon 190]AKT52053.1 anthranilate phosphoribosyltransferase [Arsenicicoccus sp. oral taxon 190]